MKIANQNNNNLLTTMIIDDSKDDYIRTVENICIPMIYRFDRLMFVFKDVDENIIHLNGEFELQLTIEDVCDQLHISVPSTNLFSMIEVFGNNSKKEVKLDSPLSFNKCYISSVSRSMNDTSNNDIPSIEILTLYPLPTIDSIESHSLNRESFSL